MNRGHRRRHPYGVPVSSGNDGEPKRAKVPVEREHVVNAALGGEHAGEVIDEGNIVVVVAVELRRCGVEGCPVRMDHGDVRPPARDVGEGVGWLAGGSTGRFGCRTPPTGLLLTQ